MSLFKPKDYTGINLKAEGMDTKKIAVVFPWIIKILNTTAGDAVKIAAIEVVKQASKGEIQNVNISNCVVNQGTK